MNLDALTIWTTFSMISFSIVVAGYFLSKYGDVIGNKSSLGENWVGVILLAAVTSLPELVSGISAIRITRAPDIAAGAIFGSCVFNISIIAILDFFSRRGSVFSRAGKEHLQSGAYGVLMLAVAIISLKWFPRSLEEIFPYVGLSSLVLVALYFIVMKASLQSGNQESPHESQAEEAVEKSTSSISLSFAVKGFIVAALVVVGAGIALPEQANQIVKVMGWQQAFVGTLFVALATSLPELIVTLSAFRLGAVNMAFGNLLGSNLFNLMILAVLDGFYLEGALLKGVSQSHAVTGLSSILMTLIVMWAIAKKVDKKQVGFLSVPGFLLVLIYCLNTYLVFQ